MSGEEVSEADPQQTVEGWQRAPIEGHTAKEPSRPETRPLCVQEPRNLVWRQGLPCQGLDTEGNEVLEPTKRCR